MCDKKIIIVIVLLLVFLALSCYGCHDYQCGIRDVREQLDRARNDQHKITDGINDAEKQADRITEGIEAAEKSADRIAVDLNDAGEIIADSKRILEAVRQRTKTN